MSDLIIKSEIPLNSMEQLKAIIDNGDNNWQTKKGPYRIDVTVDELKFRIFHIEHHHTIKFSLEPPFWKSAIIVGIIGGIAVFINFGMMINFLIISGATFLSLFIIKQNHTDNHYREIQNFKKTLAQLLKVPQEEVT